MEAAADASTYDFVIVGSGPAGAVIASRLSSSTKKPSILLLEAGPLTVDQDALVLAERFHTLMTYPQDNWRYETEPQNRLANRAINYSRGRGLGGSSRINFACYTVGPRGDFDYWAELVGDEFFGWQNSRKRFNSIESYESKVNPEYAKYVDLTQAEHGSDGPLAISLPDTWERGLSDVLEAAQKSGVELNSDINSGNPIGIGIVPSTARNGMRATAASFLKDPPSNLTVVGNSLVTKILLEGKKAIGVMVGEKTYLASKEVIVSAGALNTPQLLLLSGIGDKSELSVHGIESVHHVPAVGKGLEDHLMVPFSIKLKEGYSDRPAIFGNPKNLADAKSQFKENGTGPLSSLYNAVNMGWFHPSESLRETEEFRNISAQLQNHLKDPTVPIWELVTHSPTLHPEEEPTKPYLTFVIIMMQPQSKGTVTLKSSNPLDPPVSDPNLLDSAFDRASFVDATRTMHSILTSPPIAERTDSLFSMPASMSEADILEHAANTAATSWHMSCTAKMGRDHDGEGVVDTKFRVKGLQNLRVADMSVTPFVPSCHTVSWAYQIGAMAAERLIGEYELE